MRFVIAFSLLALVVSLTIIIAYICFCYFDKMDDEGAENEL